MEYLPERGLLDTKDQEPFLKNLLDVNSNELVKGFRVQEKLCCLFMQSKR